MWLVIDVAAGHVFMGGEGQESLPMDVWCTMEIAGQLVCRQPLVQFL